jgi:hypothetical protein
MSAQQITEIIGNFPYRIALAGGWIDQPFVSKFNPKPPGSMVVIGVEPTFPWMDRCGIASSTRRIALERWGCLPKADPEKLVEELYVAENRGKADPSGSQDMIGLIYPGICRLDYDIKVKGGFFPCHIETCNDPKIARWIEKVIHVLPVAPRPDGYTPLGVKNLTAGFVQRLSQSGKDCYDAILACDVKALGESMNECMTCWETLMPNIVRHPAIKTDLLGIMRHYQSKYPGAMYSGCGGGYLFVASEKSVPGAFTIQVRIVENTK